MTYPRERGHTTSIVTPLPPQLSDPIVRTTRGVTLVGLGLVGLGLVHVQVRTGNFLALVLYVNLPHASFVSSATPYPLGCALTGRSECGRRLLVVPTPFQGVVCVCALTCESYHRRFLCRRYGIRTLSKCESRWTATQLQSC